MAAVSIGRTTGVITHETKKAATKPLDQKIKDTFTGFITIHLKPWHAAVEAFYKYLQEAKKDSSKTLPRFDLPYGKSLSGNETNFTIAFESLQIASPDASEQHLLDLRDRALACAYLLAFQKARHQMQDEDLPSYEEVQTILTRQSALPHDLRKTVLIDALKRVGTTDIKENRAIFHKLMESIFALKLSLEEHACLHEFMEYVLTYELSAEQVDEPFPLDQVSAKA
ncbi:MAG TPA: hypothetical protein VLG44_08635 [Chlamydiales bacterium]|nr:hypothetical protein [Chlamydiales bacterium]